MNEKTFSSDFMRKWKKETKSNLWFHKIADPTIWGAPTSKRAVDYLGCLNGRMFGIEWKYHRGGRMPLKSVRSSQIETLEAIQVAGGSAYIFIGTVYANEKIISMVPIDAWCKMLLYERLSCDIVTHFIQYLYCIPKYQKPYRKFLDKMEEIICQK